MATGAATERLTERLDPCTHALCERARRFDDEADPYLRGLIATRVYRDHPDLPVVLKRAEVLARTVERIEPVILGEERIVGAAYRRFRVHPGVSDPDDWRIKVLHPERHGFDEQWPLPADAREELGWWRGREVGLWGRNTVRKRSGWLSRYGVASPHGLVQGHTLPDHGILLRAGMSELRRRIAGRLETATADPRRDQLHAMDRCLEGLSRHCLRCADAARRKAAEVESPVLKERVRSAAANCEAVAAGPPVLLRFRPRWSRFLSHCGLLHLVSWLWRRDCRPMLVRADVRLCVPQHPQ